jgi:hypothetical protein
MWKIVAIYIGISLALFCSRLKGKDVLDKAVRQRQAVKGNRLISYKIDHTVKHDSTLQIFYIQAAITRNAETVVVNDTISINVTRDGILVNEAN